MDPRRALWQRLQTEEPELAGYLQALAKVAGKPYGGIVTFKNGERFLLNGEAIRSHQKADAKSQG